MLFSLQMVQPSVPQNYNLTGTEFNLTGTEFNLSSTEFNLTGYLPGLLN